MRLSGSLRLLALYDVAEQIRLDPVRSAIPGATAPAPLRETSDYVRFENPPVVEALAPIELEPGLTASGRAKYYDYGVVSLELQIPFDCEWPELIRLSHRWVSSPIVDRKAEECLSDCLKRHAAALVKLNPKRLDEDYCVVYVAAAPGVTAAQLLADHGGEIAQIVRGEEIPLAPEEQEEILQNRLSYFPDDLFVAGWNAAFLCDTPEGAASSMPLIEYANSQLLEYRYYDALLTNVLHGVYAKLEKTGPQARWRLAREAARLNTILIDVRELSERTDTAIKFVGDMFSARLYRLAATRVGVPDFRRLVDNKLRTAGELYGFMVSHYNEQRAFLLESMIVIILIIDLILLLRGE